MSELDGVSGAWKGGPCPRCGDEMPANVVHCISCRAMLNAHLEDDSIEIPQFVPLPEIKLMKKAKARGHYIRCGGCREELRINAKYVGARVSCRHCEFTFDYDDQVEQIAIYTTCPHCSEELRASTQFVGQDVACRFCSGALRLEG